MGQPATNHATRAPPLPAERFRNTVIVFETGSGTAARTNTPGTFS
jgi:hypothetical protein